MTKGKMTKLCKSIFCFLFLFSCAGKPVEAHDKPTLVQAVPSQTAPTAVQAASPEQSVPEEQIDHDSADDCSEVLVLPSLEKGSKILLVGDSLAVGLSREFNIVAKKAGYVPVVHAKIGSSTMQWLKWIKGDLRTHHPKLVVVSLGTNDAAGYGMVEKMPDMHRKLVDAVLNADSFIVWVGPPAISTKRVKKIEEVRQIIKEATPIYFASEELDIRLFDGIHSDGVGYSRWMQKVWHEMSAMMITYDFE
jgi:hypothetical protein